MVDVFISYPRRERDSAERIKAKLEALKLDLFFDIEGIDGGAEFPDVINRALRSCRAVLACWSPLYFERRWCMIECRFAASASPSILVPVALARIGRDDIPADFLATNYLRLDDWSGEEEHEDWNRTLQSLAKLVRRELAPPLKKGIFGGLKVAGEAPAAPAPAAARADIVADLKDTWRNFPARSDEAAVEKFLARVRAAAPGSGLEFEVEHHLDELKRARAERAAREAAEAEARRRAEEAARKAEEERREKPRRAVEAARAGRSVAERAFPIELPGVSGWPSPEMVAIPPGRFLMGSPRTEAERSDDEGPQREVTIAHAFALGKHAVTFAEWDAAIAAGAKLQKPDDKGWGRANHPVINVSWEDAQAYIAWLNERLGTGTPSSPSSSSPIGIAGNNADGGVRAPGYRLPSEAEWEYACRAGTTTPFSFGETISTTQANYDGDLTYGKGAKGEYRKKTLPVGYFPANQFGLHEMHGNVWEWCEDCWNPNYSGLATNGSAITTGDCSNRVFRGGSWSGNPNRLRSAFRLRYTPTIRLDDLGFRLARTLLPVDL